MSVFKEHTCRVFKTFKQTVERTDEKIFDEKQTMKPISDNLTVTGRSKGDAGLAREFVESNGEKSWIIRVEWTNKSRF